MIHLHMSRIHKGIFPDPWVIERVQIISVDPVTVAHVTGAHLTVTHIKVFLETGM